MSEAFVYRWTDKTTGMMYIGVHKGGTDDGYIASGKAFLEDYNKRPSDFTREILYSGTYSDSRDLECDLLIDNYAATNPLFYNRWNNTGKMFNCNPHSEETKRKMSESHTGKKFTEKHKKNLSAKHRNVSGNNNPMFGKRHTDETKLKIAKTKVGRKHTTETKLKMSLSKKRIKI